MAEIPEPPQKPKNDNDLSAIVGNELSAQQTSEAQNQQALQAAPPMEEPQQGGQGGLAPPGGEMELIPMEGETETSTDIPTEDATPAGGFAAEIPQEVEGGLPRETEEFIQEIAESIISEKWERVSEEFGDLAAWKDRVNMDLQAIKQEILRVESRLDNLQNTIIGRIGEYDTHIASVGTDVKALEEVLKKMMQPLSTNIKELSRIAADLKKGKSTKKKR